MKEYMSESEKRNVMDNIENISAEDLYFKYIKPGHIPFSKIKDTGRLEASKRRKIEDLIAQDEAREEECWVETLKQSTIEAYEKYILAYPTGKHIQLAEFGIETLKQKEANENKFKKDLLDKLKANLNGDFTPKIISEYLTQEKITKTDLINLGVPLDVIESLAFFKEPTLELGEIPEFIPEGFTEVYFWGIPGSGKTCALSGILSHADKSAAFGIGSGPGYHYMTHLKNIFNTNIGFLPAATVTELTQCLPFELTDDHGKKHPIALIELSGEIFTCYYNEMANRKFTSDKHRKTFTTVTNFLNSKNRKIHFFVFDFGKNPKEKDDNGLCQDDYLTAAQKYFKDNDIFKELTDAIYVVVTKIDLLEKKGDVALDPAQLYKVRLNKAKDYLNTNYPSFVNRLKDVCRDYRINDNSDLSVLPFSLGEVYFNKICRFNNTSSAEIVSILKNKTGILRGKSKLWDFFKQ
ncbi:hypothetical protein A4H97_16470 [Niastella yeongjuensis]|uniref:Uncharacterized protein n=1 Tax=Niastella yeongjuensis TaxID=354355 RepID=A0A1V9E1P4_9BACT|nr:hypothetical protein [Niastella yeongjuensis]OQP39815.1 hypothetical protein A4H97_16470 [Niastella yeongjuensis]SEO06393.1 hypothetical protein SAMN05660816_02041 [Niastella yeongjuensis]